MKPVRFKYFAPETVAEAIRLLEEHGDEARVLAGGPEPRAADELPPGSPRGPRRHLSYPGTRSHYEQRVAIDRRDCSPAGRSPVE